ncbi:hypothetical protein [Corynebacterium sp. CCM 9204]|uniref:hypothetical protein n=1 Tax=Corynebacterium sp. CCM 9204 TaxID=3057616 RepID=UPI0035241ABB
MKVNRVAIVLVVLVVAIIIAVYFVSRGKNGDGKETGSVESSTLAIPGPDEFDPEQRHFPREFFDDSQYQVGKYAADPGGRPVYMPHAVNGEPFGEFQPREEMDCSLPGVVNAQQQYVHGRFMLVSEHDGPTNFDHLVPTGYAHSAVGAAVAASNAATMAIGFYDQLALDYWRDYIDTSETEARLKLGVKTAGPDVPAFPGMSGFKIEACSSNIVVAHLAYKNVGSESWIVFRLPMRWANGMWEMIGNDLDAKRTEQPTIYSLDGWVKVNAQ